MVPAVLAILLQLSEFVLLSAYNGGGGAVLFYFGEAARPDLPMSVILSGPVLRNTHHSYHLIQHVAFLWWWSCRHCFTLPPRKRSVFGQGTRLGPTPTCLGTHHISRASKLPQTSAFRTHNTNQMAARSSVARAVRQLTYAAAKRPAPCVCQRWQLQAQKQRLFSVSAACMLKMLGENPGC
jgi:hypothetical protein